MNLAPVFRAAGYEYQPVVFTRGSWDELFPDNQVASSLGTVELAPEALDLPDGHLLGLVKATLAEPMAVFLRADAQTFWRPVLVKGEVAAFAVVEVIGESAKLELRAEFPALPDVESILIADLDGLDEAVFKGLSLSLSANDIMGLPACRSVITNFGLASALGHWQHDFLKGDHGPIPADARWITVHPNGDGSKGVPILIQPTPHGHFRVIGGAGGKLNMLKLRGVKSEAEYRQEHAERADLKKRAHKEQIRRDKELGIHTAKQQARANLEQQAKDAEREHIQAVAAEMGWDEKDLKPNVEGLSEQAAAKAERDHAAALKARVRAAVQLQREVLKADREKRTDAGLASIPIDPTSGELSVQDLDPIRVSDPAGLTHSFAGRAAEAGLDDAKLAQQVADVKDLSPEEQAAAREKKLERESVAAAIKEEIKDLAKPYLAVKVADTEKAVKILKSERKLKDLQAQVRKARKEVDTSLVEPKAFVAVVPEASDADIQRSITEELNTIKAVSFLAGVKKVGDEDALAPHVLTGAHNALNGFSQAVGGASLMDRSVVDVLGVAGAAQVLARRIHSDYADKLEEITAGLEDYHVASAPERQQAALDEAANIQERIAALAPEGDLAEASAINRQKRDALRAARTTMGQALGEMEATASLIMALRGGHKDEIQVSLGDTPLSSALQQLWAVGLAREDYQIDRVAGNVFLTLKGSGMDKLAAPVDRDNLERVRRNLAIQRGAEDEDNWLPDGFAKRPDLALHLSPGVTDSLAVPLDTSAPDLEAALRDFVGSRTADGHRAADILADVQSATYFDRIGAARADEYRAALAAVIPTKGKNGKLARVEDLQPQFEAMADAYVEKLGGDRSTLNRQTIPVDTVSQDALHRALSEEPAGVAAYKPIGDLTHEDVKALRDWFATNIAKESPEGAQLRQAAEQLAGQEPNRYEVDMFGDSVESPAWSAWKSDYDQAQAEHAASGLTWAGYVKAMRSPQQARAAVQDMIRSRVSISFARHYNTLRPESAIKVGKTVVRHNLNHLDAVDPQAREQRLAQQRQLIDGLRERTMGGQYAAGAVNVDKALEDQAAFNQAQMGFFAAEDLPTTDTAMKVDERHTIGQAAENTLAEMMGVVGRQFKPGQPVKLFQPTMSGQGIDRQRAVKMLVANKRMALAAGVGAGKTSISLAAFSHLHAAGKVKKGIFLVPSIVQKSFSAEALRFLEAGKFQWHAEPGASYEERLAAYQDPENHFSVVTHQSFRNDMLRMAVDAGLGASPAAVATSMGAMTKEERAAFTKAVLAHHGVSFDYAMADEAHNLLNREGKENSRLSNVTEGVTDNAEYFLSATADPTKNDASEAFSLLQKMDGSRYSDRDAFMRRYGGDTQAAKEGLQREMARHLFAFSLNPDVAVTKREEKIAPSSAQQAALEAIDRQSAALRIAKLSGKVDVESAKALAPNLFEGADPSEHDAIAKVVAADAGLHRRSATRRVLDNHPQAAKLDRVAAIAGERKGQQGVVFVRSLAAVDAIKKRLEAEGHSVVGLTGADTAEQKAEKIRAFNPESGKAKADIIVSSDAGATGANLQSGRWLVQYDTSDTAYIHAQRQGRINRIGQKNAVELIDLVSDHPDEKRARQRLAEKYELRDLMTSRLDGLDDTGLGHYLAQRGFGAQKTQGDLF